MKHAVWGAVLLVVLVLAGIYFAIDPATEGWFPQCRFFQMTGYKCPGCGSQRMLHSLLHLDIVAAFRYNAYLLTLFPLLLLLIVWEGWQNRLSGKWRNAVFYTLVGLLLVSVLLWWLLRNVLGW